MIATDDRDYDKVWQESQFTQPSKRSKRLEFILPALGVLADYMPKPRPRITEDYTAPNLRTHEHDKEAVRRAELKRERKKRKNAAI